MRGNGEDMPSRYIFVSVKWAEYLLNSICIRMLHQIIFVTLTQLNLYSEAARAISAFCKTHSCKFIPN